MQAIHVDVAYILEPFEAALADFGGVLVVVTRQVIGFEYQLERVDVFQ